MAWAVKTPDGDFLHESIEPTRRESIYEARFEASNNTPFSISTPNWKHFYRQGYRCVQVEIKELTK